MSHIKVITCLHVTQKFYVMNKELLANLNPTFQCACNDTYGSHQLFFCVCMDCYKNIAKKNCNVETINKDCNIETINKKWLKFCVLRTSLDVLTFRGIMRFFSFNDIIKIIPIFWCYRESAIKEK